MKYSDFVAAVNAGQIKQVTIDGLNISGEKTNGSQFETVRPQVEDTELMPSLNKQNVVRGHSTTTSRHFDATSHC